MLNILCICGNGMGTSTIMKVNLKNICEKHHIQASIESCAFSEAMAYIATTDLIITSPEWSRMLPASNAVLIETKNLIDVRGVTESLLEAIKENFPYSLKE